MDPARSFGSAAQCYDRIRPRYPAEALRWALGADRLRLVDLGAGTGILTRQLVALGHDVTAVEPDPQMREQLHRTCGLLPLDGTAETIPLPDCSVDGVLAGQAYHWFDRNRAHPEIARVLRPGGRFVPLWNVRDETVPWLRELSRIAEGGVFHGGVEGGLAGRAFGEWFSDVELAEFRHAATHTVDSLLDLVRSRSFYLTASPDERCATEAAIRHLLATHPDLPSRTTFDLPYVTMTYRATRL